MQQREQITVPRVRGHVEVEPVALVFYRVLHNNTVVKPKRGRWLLPAQGSRDGRVEMRARGLVPGFQRLFVEGQEVYNFGAHVTLAQRLAMFSPLALIAIIPWLALPVGLIMFFMNISFVKNPAMAPAMRVAVPLINTVAAGVIFAALRGWI